MHWLRGPTSCVGRKATSPLLRGRGGGDLAGVGARGMRAGGFPGNPGGLVVSILKTAGARARLTKPEAVDVAPSVRRSEAAGARMVPPREGNEARGDGRRGVGVPHSTAEAGESSRRDPVEGRGHRQMDPLEGQMANTPRLDPVSTKRQRIAELARHAPEMVFTSMAHHIDMHVLRAAYAATRKDGAVGLDGQTAADYVVNLEANLQSLLDRFKSGQYVAPPVRRVHIPKGGWPEDSTHRDSDVRGQGAAAGRRDGAGECLRAGLPGL